MSELLKAARAALEALDSHPDNSRRSFRAAADGLRAALAQPEQQAAPKPRIWYMRGNHTFRELPLDVEQALADMRDDRDAGHTYGMLCGRSGDRIDHGNVHAGKAAEWDQFEANARPWLEKVVALAAHPPAQPHPRTLREGEVMGAYMDFDRTADPAWTSAEYLTRFGAFISERTVRAHPEQAELQRLKGEVMRLHSVIAGLRNDWAGKTHSADQGANQMTNIHKAAQAALEALEVNDRWHYSNDDHGGYAESSLCTQTQGAIASLRRVLSAQPEQQAPWREMIEDTKEVFSYDSPETPQTTRDVIEYVKSYLEVYVDKASGITVPRNIAKALESEWEQRPPKLQPVGFVSPEQVARLLDPQDLSGRYIPMRKTPAGNFTLAIYAHPPAQPERQATVLPAGWRFTRGTDGRIGIYGPPPKDGESRRTSDAVYASTNRDLYDLLGRLADHMAAQPEQQAWTDEQIEARVKHLGARWNGDHWIIEDADLHPLGRALAQPEQQPEQQSPTIAVPRGLLQRVMKIAWGDAEGLSVGQCQDLASVESLPSYKEQTK